MSQQQQSRGLTQSKDALLKSYTMRLKDDIKAMLDNFTEIIKLARVSCLIIKNKKNSDTWKKYMVLRYSNACK